MQSCIFHCTFMYLRVDGRLKYLQHFKKSQTILEINIAISHIVHCCTFWNTFLGLDQKLYSPIKHISLPNIRPLLAWNMISFSQRQSLTILFSKLLSIYCLSVPGKYFVTCLDESSHHNKSQRTGKKQIQSLTSLI